MPTVQEPRENRDEGWWKHQYITRFHIWNGHLGLIFNRPVTQSLVSERRIRESDRDENNHDVVYLYIVSHRVISNKGT